jgi:uncharacterized protein YegL
MSDANKRIQTSSPMHMVLIADDSGSMEGEPAAAVTQGIQNWILELQSQTRGKKAWFRFTLIAFGTTAEILGEEACNINDVDPTSLKLQGTMNTTNMAAALDLAREVIARDGAKAKDCPPFVFVYTDGKVDDPEATIISANDLKSMFIPCGKPRLVTLGFGDADEAFLRQLATSPEFFKGVKDAKALARLLPAMGTPTQMKGSGTVEAFEQQIAGSEPDAI